MGVEGFGEAVACHVLKGHHRVYLRSHQKAFVSKAAYICNEFLMELPASPQDELGCNSREFETNSTNSNNLTKRIINTGGISLNKRGGAYLIREEELICLLLPTSRGQATYSFHLVNFNQTH